MRQLVNGLTQKEKSTWKGGKNERTRWEGVETVEPINKSDYVDLEKRLSPLSNNDNGKKKEKAGHRDWWVPPETGPFITHRWTVMYIQGHYKGFDRVEIDFSNNRTFNLVYYEDFF